MKYMKTMVWSFIVMTMAFACQKEISTPTDSPPPCVGPEENLDTLTRFTIFEKGEQEFGYAKGTKINMDYESSAYLRINKDSICILILAGFWPPVKGHSAVGEQIFIGPLDIPELPACYELTRNKGTKDSIRVSYGISNDDVGILQYRLDMAKDNKFEIIEFDKQNLRLKARLKASFIGEKEYLPDLPKHVRFIDTYIEHGY